MSTPLAPWQELALVALSLLSLFYLVAFRVWSGNALVADGVFGLAIAALVTTVAMPSVFDVAGARVVEWSPLPEALAEADARAADLAALPGRLIDGALVRLGFGGDDEEVPEDAVAGAVEVVVASGVPAETSEDAEDGWLTTQVRPSVDGLVALILRVATAGAAVLVLLLALLLRIVLGLARRLRRIGQRLTALEATRDPDASDGPRALEGSGPA